MAKLITEEFIKVDGWTGTTVTIKLQNSLELMSNNF